MPDFGFVGASYVAASITQDDQELINWYPEVDSTEDKKGLLGPGDRTVIALYPTPGLALMTQLSTIGPVRAMLVLPGGQTLLAVCGTALYSITLSYVATQVGALLSSTGPVSMTDNGVSAYMCDGSNRYYYTWGTGAFAIVADGAFMGANTVDVIDNFMVYNNPNSNQWGCTNVASVVSGGLNFTSTFVAPGNVVGLICDHRNVFILGERASEVWNDVGSSPFPFAIIPGTSMQHGLAARGSIARLGESFAFLAQDDRGQAIVVQMNGYAPGRISTHAVENAIGKYAVISDAIAYTYQQAGHEFYMLTFPTADATWVYDLATGLWHRRASRDSYNVYHRHPGNCCAVFGGKVVVGDYQNGRIYSYSLSTFTEATGTAGATVPLPCLRRAKHLTTDLKRQFFGDLQLQFQPGVGLSGNAAATGQNYLNLPTATVSYATAPDSAINSITGDIDIQVQIACDSYTLAQTILSKWSTSIPTSRSYRFTISALGNLVFETSPNGTAIVTATSTAVIPASAGGIIWVRATRDVDNGASGNTTTFYTSSDGVTWTQLGSPVINAGTTSIFDNAILYTVGAQFIAGSGLSPLIGKIYRARLYNGIGGTLVADFNPNNALISDTTVSSATGEVYTLVASATIAGNYISATQGANPQAMLRWSNDGGSTWSNEHWRSIGQQGHYKNRAIWRNLGEARDRIFEVYLTDPVYRVIVSAELSATSAAH